jgi:hypothetical protein
MHELQLVPDTGNIIQIMRVPYGEYRRHVGFAPVSGHAESALEDVVHAKVAGLARRATFLSH